MRAGTAVVLAALLAGGGASVAAAPLPVRYEEGVTHGYLLLRSSGGSIIAQGELVQTAHGSEIEKRMTFRFEDGSLYDERVRYTAQGIFVLKRYELTQQGPSFLADVEIALDASGAYRIRSKKGDKEKEKVEEGKLEMPRDVCNGLIFIVLKSIPRGGAETVHYVAFMPKPRVIELRLESAGTQQVAIGSTARRATHYVMKPRLGTWLKLVATLTGRLPPDFHAWFMTDDVPAFVGFQGPLETDGPIWRIEMDAPRLPVSVSRMAE